MYVSVQVISDNYVFRPHRTATSIRAKSFEWNQQQAMTYSHSQSLVVALFTMLIWPFFLFLHICVGRPSDKCVIQLDYNGPRAVSNAQLAALTRPLIEHIYGHI